MAEMSFGTNGINTEKEKKNVIVNYIPPEITEPRLNEMFSTCGSVVGVKLMRDKTGTSLGYAFVNFNSELEAARAIEIFDGNQMGNKKNSGKLRSSFVGRNKKRKSLHRWPAEDYEGRRLEKLV